jgi:predicted SAM-dependent methyltransferase
MAPGTGAETDGYLQRPEERKLHLGCGRNILAGWLNADIEPCSPDVAYIDLTKPLPFQDACFDYVFSEHVIEHFSYQQGLAMLRESHRVLRPGGRIRVSTPDLAFVMGLYGAEKSDVQQRYIAWSTSYIAWSTGAFISEVPVSSDTFVINNFVRDWGHQFIYDEKELRASLLRAGFRDVERCALNDSSDENLRNLENERRLPPGFLRLETFTLEASKVDGKSEAAITTHK